MRHRDCAPLGTLFAALRIIALLLRLLVHDLHTLQLRLTCLLIDDLTVAHVAAVFGPAAARVANRGRLRGVADRSRVGRG